jgi:uncharacterized repeat protein (TIGR04076 family)
MKTINVKPIEVIGNCRAQITVEDEFQIEGMRLMNPRQSNICFMALGHLPPIVSQLQSENHFFAHVTCPDCLARLDQENRVVFLLGHADKWELCRALSEYDRLCRQCAEEPEPASQLRVEAIQYQQEDEYFKAVHSIESALTELKRMVVG